MDELNRDTQIEIDYLRRLIEKIKREQKARWQNGVFNLEQRIARLERDREK